jgi:RNA polymerase sigma-54 factor
MTPQLNLEARPGLELQVSPVLVSYAEILELPWLELQQRITHEVEANPALERVETGLCDVCGDRLDCAHTSSTTGSRLHVSEVDPIAEAMDPIAAFRTPFDDARAELTPEQSRIGEFLFDSLNDRGFLECPLADVAMWLGTSLEEVEQVVSIVRDLGWPTFAAHDLQECLLLQLHLVDEPETRELLRRLIASCWGDLGQVGAAELARNVGASVAEVKSALAYLRSNMQPWATMSTVEVWARPGGAPRLLPNLAIRRAEHSSGVEVSVAGAGRLRVEPLYQSLSQSSDDPRVGDAVRRATTFLLLIERRAQTLCAIVEYALGRDTQSRPERTRADVARALGLHESTVSRAVASKIVLLPDGRLVPLADLFDSRRVVEHALQRLVGAELRPLSDAELTAALHARGYSVARRTVAKYREALGIPAAHLRS